MEVVAGHVLHRARAAADPSPVAGDEDHLDDRVAHAPDTQLPGERHVGGDHPADGRVVGLVDRPLLAAVGEQPPELADAASPTPRRRASRQGRRRRPVEHRRPQLRVDLAGVRRDRCACGRRRPSTPRAVARRGPHRVDDVGLACGWIRSTSPPAGSRPPPRRRTPRAMAKSPHRAPVGQHLLRVHPVLGVERGRGRTPARRGRRR